MITDVKSLLFAYNDAINDACHDQVREFNINMARSKLDDISPELAAEVILLREALAFYADENPKIGEGPWLNNSTDFGNVARNALKGIACDK